MGGEKGKGTYLTFQIGQFPLSPILSNAAVMEALGMNRDRNRYRVYFYTDPLNFYSEPPPLVGRPTEVRSK